MHNFNTNKFKMLFTHDWFNLTNEIVAVELPSLSLSFFDVAVEGGLSIRQAGDDLDFGELTTTIVVDEELSLLKDLQNYIFELKNYQTGDYNNISIPCVLQIYCASNEKLLREIEFTNLRPSTFSSVTLETNSEDIEFRTVEVTWVCDFWKIL